MTFDLTKVILNASVLPALVEEAKANNLRLVSVEKVNKGKILMKVFYQSIKVEATCHYATKKMYVFQMLKTYLNEKENIKYYLLDIDSLTQIINSINHD